VKAVPMRAFEDWLRGLVQSLQRLAHRPRVSDLLDARIFLGPF
jgi:hypothetical protein